MKPFEKIMKRPTLPNYYRQRHFQWPDTLPEIFDYLRSTTNCRSCTAATTGLTMRCASGSAVRASLHRSS